MAITYLSGERIQGSSVAPVAITDDMTTNLGWTANSTPSGQGYDATNDYVVFKGINTSSDETESPRISMDMQDADFLNGSNVDDTAFTAKFELRLTTYNASTSGENRNYIGFFSHNSWGGTAGDYFKLEITGEGSSAKRWRVVVGDGELHEGVSASYKSTDFDNDAVIDTTYYITFTKTGGNTHKVGISTNSDYVTGVDERTVTRSSLTGLRYFAVKGRGDTQGAANGETTGYIDNFYISSGTTDEKGTLTDVPVGTRYEETDTRKIFRRKGAGISVTGLKAYFTMGEATGDLINRAAEYGSTDAIANFDLSVTGATQNVSGKYNKCVSFSGDQRAIADDSSLSDTAFLSNNGAAWTICFWSAVEGLASGGNIEGDQAWFSTSQFGTGQNGVMCRVAATVAPPSNPAYTSMVLGTNGTDKVSGNSTANGLDGLSSPTGWHFIAVQYDDSTGIARDMKDNSGTWNNIFTGQNLTNTTTPSAKFRLAQWANNNNNLNGDMEAVSIWNRILTTAELTSLYSSTEVGQGLAPSWVEKGTA
jgi:hypothetical protein